MRENVKRGPINDTGLKRVMAFASVLIVISILLTGTYVYRLTEHEAVKKLKTRDLVTLAESISSKVDARIDKEIETSLALAHDPTLLKWLDGGETDAALGALVHARTDYLHRELGYSSTFIVGTKTRHFWNETGTIIDTMTENDPDDSWFFDALRLKKAAAVNFDYNNELGDTFAFVNALAGSVDAPLGVVGVGINLHELSDEFASYKDGQGINLWLIDGSGKIYLSDAYEHNGSNIGDVMTAQAQQQVLQQYDAQVRGFDYVAQEGVRMDLISYPLRSTDLHLLVEVERRRTVAFLETIRWNTFLAVAISIVAMTFFFFYVSRKLANPYKRAIALNQQLETQVEERTQELSARNRELMDSLSYAKLLQESVLPKEQQLQSALREHFVIWRPRDVVGGDFYWSKQVGGRTLLAVGDCTGHGVPGAFMTLLAISTLNRIVESGEAVEPADILGRLNRLMKETLRQDGQPGVTDDGLDIGICCIEEGQVLFAGARCSLHRADEAGLASWPGDRRSVGYRKTPRDYAYTTHRMPVGSARYYMATDGFYDQNGGERDYSFGKKRFADLIVRYGGLPLEEQKLLFLRELEAYMGNERQRDDITVMSFQVA
ncbi:SpoIIE family protein phosphatase [Paenibacillus cymbidii]|uniref:SpoIIE family protein phosphatase n=1 Tax=Paenibacillus cymbidii TaxID=1639034 RepID=UPI001080F148|nr:SpoIIE family protein phosphatase [Paenibacillus cymbidii]